MVSLYLDVNKLQGSIPRALFCICSLMRIGLSSNELSGSIEVIESPRLLRLMIDENKLTGSFPASSGSRLIVLMCSGNMLEGTLPGNVMTSFLEILGFSRTAGQIRGLRGSLPRKTGQASHLQHLMISHQNLGGSIPPLIATLTTLVLYSNRFNLFQSANLKSDRNSTVLMHINMLTCSPPTCGGVGTNLRGASLFQSHAFFSEGKGT